MTRLTDGTRTVEIAMTEWTGSGYTPDWSNDFFQVGSLPYNEETETYAVPDVDYCIDMAQDWANAKGDYLDDKDYYTEDEIGNRCVTVEEI